MKKVQPCENSAKIVSRKRDAWQSFAVWTLLVGLVGRVSRGGDKLSGRGEGEGRGRARGDLFRTPGRLLAHFGPGVQKVAKKF